MDLPIPDTLEVLISHRHQMARMEHRIIELMCAGGTISPEKLPPPDNIIALPVTKDGLMHRPRKRKVTLTDSQVHSLLAEHDTRYQAYRASGMTSSAFYRRVRALG